MTGRDDPPSSFARPTTSPCGRSGSSRRNISPAGLRSRRSRRRQGAEPKPAFGFGSRALAERACRSSHPLICRSTSPDPKAFQASSIGSWPAKRSPSSHATRPAPIQPLHCACQIRTGGIRSERGALLPRELRSFRGYRLLTEYFACPERFLFVALRGLAEAFALGGEQCDVVLLFSRSSPILANALSPANFRLFATPAVNLFEKQLGRVQVDPHTHEHHVIPDRTRPLDFEVFRILDVRAYAGDNVEPVTVAPLYAFGALLYDWTEALFYTTQLRWRRLSTKEQRMRRRTDYVGTETWISLTSPGDPARLDEVSELAVRALVSNRELPELLTFKGDKHFVVHGRPCQGNHGGAGSDQAAAADGHRRCCVAPDRAPHSQLCDAGCAGE